MFQPEHITLVYSLGDSYYKYITMKEKPQNLSELSPDLLCHVFHRLCKPLYAICCLFTETFQETPIGKNMKTTYSQQGQWMTYCKGNKGKYLCTSHIMYRTKLKADDVCRYPKLFTFKMRKARGWCSQLYTNN